MHFDLRRRTVLGSLAAGALALASVIALSAYAQHGHGKGGEKGEEAKQEGHGGGGGGHGGHGGGMEGKHKHHVPGTVDQMCPEQGDMPPHYCEPSYKVMSSVKGVQISDVALVADKEVMVTLYEINPMFPGINQAIVIVGGTGDLAGAVTVNGGWKQTTTIHLRFQGEGSLYSQRSMHLHLFPLTGP